MKNIVIIKTKVKTVFSMHSQTTFQQSEHQSIVHADKIISQDVTFTDVYNIPDCIMLVL